MSDELDPLLLPDDERPLAELVLRQSKRITRGLASCLDAPFIVRDEFRQSLADRMAEEPGIDVMRAAEGLGIRMAALWMTQHRKGMLVREDFEVAAMMEWPEAFAHISRAMRLRGGLVYLTG